MNKKTSTLLIIFILLSPNIAIASNPLNVASGWIKGKASGLSMKYWRSGSLLTKDVRDVGQAAFLLLVCLVILWDATHDLEDNIQSHILQNPPIYSEGFKSMFGFFVSMIQPFYIIAIIITAFYIMFVSDSYVRRSKAKSLLGKLVAGLIITSFSLPILWMLFGMSESVTKSILNQGLADRAIEEYTATMWTSYFMLAASLAAANLPQVSTFFKGLRREIRWSAKLPGGSPVGFDKKGVKTWKNFWNTVKIKGKLSRTTPFLMFFTVLFGGLYTLISIRYVMVTLLSLLFPLMIFFMSFDMTRRVGRIMLEQTILITILQVFYAIIFTIVGATLTVIPPHIYSEYAFKYTLNGVAIVELSLFAGVSCMVIYLGPIVLFNMFQKLFPP